MPSGLLLQATSRRGRLAEKSEKGKIQKNPKLLFLLFHLYVWGDKSPARRTGPDEHLDEGDEDVDDDGQADRDDEEQGFPFHFLMLI